MDFDTFRSSLAGPAPPPGLPPVLQALWQVGRGNWDAAHQIVQAHDDRDCTWVHAHLHRREGDAANAAYWYRRADRTVADQPLEGEWEALVRALLG